MQRSQSNHTLYGSQRGTSDDASGISSDPLRTVASFPHLSRVTSNRSEGVPKDEDRHQARRRVFAYYAHALVVFNVYGIPLSFGPYLEYYYDTRFQKTPLYCLTAIPACEVACIFSFSALAPWIYRKMARPWLMAIPAIAVSVCFAISFRFEQDWHWLLLLLFKGFVMGSALGILRGVSLLCLASHYRNNFSLVSMQSGVAAMIGAASYTALAWSGLRNDHYQGLEIANFGLSFGTLALASLLLRKSKLSETLAVTMKHTQSHPPKPGNTVFHAGYLMLFFSLFVWPTFAVMLVSTPPSNQFPEFGAYVLFAAFAAGTITSIYASSAHARSKLGPVNIFIAASIVAGCSALAPAWSPYFYISLAWGCVYGAMLGAMLTLHVKVTTAFHSSGISYHPRMVRNFQVVSVASGIVAGSGVFLAGVFVQWEGGMRGVLTGYGVAMVVGGALMGVGRWLGWRGLRAVV